jgi:hypothetical protein
MGRVRGVLRAVSLAWRGARLSKTALGKYIIVFASLMHAGWAVLLLISPTAAGSTPVSIIVKVCGGPYRTAFVGFVASAMAIVFPFFRRRVSNTALAIMLIPQQVLLFMSAGAGIYAAAVQHYADGVPRPWPFILSDQLPVILAALLYTIAVLEAAFEPPDRIIPPLDGEEKPWTPQS